MRPVQGTDDTHSQIDHTRRDGSIRGVLLTKKTDNRDQILGLTKLNKDFSF
jgi:hypothetical protein